MLSPPPTPSMGGSTLTTGGEFATESSSTLKLFTLVSLVLVSAMMFTKFCRVVPKSTKL